MRYLTLFAVLLTGTWAPAQSPSTETVQIPFQFYNNKLIIVKAIVGNLKNINMLLDTGTTTTAITKDLAKRLNLTGTVVETETLGGRVRSESITLPTLRVGPRQFNQLRAVVPDLTAIQQTLNVVLGGIVGMDVLGTGTLTIDYTRQKVIFGSSTATQHAVPFATMQPFLTVNAVIDKQQVRLVLDSGSYQVIVFKNRLHPSPPRKIHSDPSAEIAGLGGSTRFSFLHSDISLGTESLGAHDVALADSDVDENIDGLLGFAQLNFHRVSFDFDKAIFSWD